MSLRAESLFSLHGKTVLVTGSTGFLGGIFCNTLLENGASVVALGRSEKLWSLTKQWGKNYGSDKVSSYQVDMYDVEQLRSVLDQILKEREPIDVLVNNAHELGPATGFNTPNGSLEESDLDQWSRNLKGGLFWPFLTTQKLGRAMKARRTGSIVNICTMYSLVAPSPELYEDSKFINPPGYSVAKAGLLAFTRYVASFWGPYGIRANAILPGPFPNTSSESENVVHEEDPFLDRLQRQTCLCRAGRPEELSGAILFLASDASTYVTGHGLVVDGGWTVR